MPLPQSELANETFKNPYLFDFMGLGSHVHEREIEKGLVAHMEKIPDRARGWICLLRSPISLTN